MNEYEFSNRMVFLIILFMVLMLSLVLIIWFSFNPIVLFNSLFIVKEKSQ